MLKNLGLEPVYLLTEPTATAIAFKGHKKESSNQKVLVVDFGGGTLDISVLQKYTNGKLEVLATDGDMLLGGDDVTNAIYDHLLEKWKASLSTVSATKKPKILIKIWKAVRNSLTNSFQAEEAKRKLTSAEYANIEIEIQPDVEVKEEISLALFNKLIGPILKKMQNVIERILKNNISSKSIDDVIMVGGSSRIPAVCSVIEKLFPGKVNIQIGINPKEAITYGAALFAESIKSNKQDDLQDITGYGIGVGCKHLNGRHYSSYGCTKLVQSKHFERHSYFRLE